MNTMNLFTPHLPYQNLNPILVEFIECVERTIQSPIDYVVAATYCFAGAAIGSRLILCDPKGYLNPPNLWTCLVAKSGIGKPPVLSILSKPFDEIQKEMDKDYKKRK